VVDVAHKVHPDLLPHRITVPQTPEQVYTCDDGVTQDEYTDVYVNPYGGSSRFAPLKQTLVFGESHVHLFAGDLGMQVVGICGLLLLLVGVTGFVDWLEKVCYWLQNSLEISLATGQLRSPQSGGILSVALLLIAFTGAAMIFLDSV